MKKFKFVSILSIFLIIFGTGYASAFFTDVETTVDYAESAYRLTDLGIVSGYTDGSFRPYDNVTRAQLAKMIVCIMDKEEIALNKGYSSRFPDVSDGYWAVPYINYVAQSGFMKGYADGTFSPERNVTYAELSAIMLRMLKYSEAYLGYEWPKNYTSKANSLGWNQGVSIGDNAIVSRALTVMLIDDALFTDINPALGTSADATGGTSDQPSLVPEQPLIALYRDKVLEDVIVMGSPSSDTNLAWNEMTILDESGSSDGDIYISDISLKNYNAGSVYSHIVIDSDNNHIIAAKSFKNAQSGELAVKNLGYTVLTNCHIISSSSFDRTLSANKVRTSKGEFTTNTANILSAVGEVGTVILNKNREVISYSARDADYAELIITDVDGNKVEYIENNELRILQLDDDFPIYIDYGEKRNYKSAIKEFSGNSLLTLYSSNGNLSFDYGLLETSSGYTVYNECFVAATKSEDSSLSSGQVKTSEGTFKLKSSDIITSGGTLGTLVLDANKKICGFAPTTMASVAVTVNHVSGDQIEYIGANGVKGNLTLDNNFVTYVDYLKTSYSLSKGQFTNGTDITLYGETYGDWEFLVIDSAKTIQPVLASHTYAQNDINLEGITINHDNLIVYRNGTTASLSDIRTNDVVYYNTKTNIMDVYTKKVTGIYYDAQPSKAYVTTVTVGGKSYTLGTIAATNKMDASVGAYEIGDRVTLLLGKNDEVVFVEEISSFNSMDYGVIMSTKTRIKESGDNDGTSEYVATMFMPDGNTYEYVTDKNYKDYIGSLVKISDSNGALKLSKLGLEKGVSGKIDKTAKTFAGKKISDDVVIIQRLNNSDGDITSAELLNFNTLNVSTVSDTQVLNLVSDNSFGDIGLIYVQQLTDSGYQYGVLASRTTSGGAENKQITYYIYTDGVLNKYTTSYSVSIANGPIMFKLENGQLKEIKALTMYASSSKYEALDEVRIKINGTVYDIDTNVKVFQCVSTNEYEEKTISDLKNASITNVKIYSNVSKNSGGAIKVIVYSAK